MESPFIMNRRLTKLAHTAIGAVLTVLLAAGSATGFEDSTTKRDTPKAAPATDVTLARARRQVLDAHPLAMFYFANDLRGRESLVAHARAMTLLGPQSYWLDREGFVHGQIRAEVLDVARHSGLALMPLVVNPHFDRSAAHALLHNPKACEHAATSLAYLAKRDHFVGWQLDIENIDPDDKLDFTNFVELVAAGVHRDGGLLSVAVVPRFSDTYPDSPPVQFQTDEWGAAYDYAALGEAADFLAVMTYDQHSSRTPPGPVAGYDWVKAVLDYALRCVPPAKLLLGLPLYGREWVETPHGTTTHSFTYTNLGRFLKNAGGKPQWDENSRTTWYQAHSGAIQRTVWFDDARSLREKLQLVESYHLRGFACWRLGVEDPRFWTLMTRKKAKNEN
jgi:spore germination protein YaaH